MAGLVRAELASQAAAVPDPAWAAPQAARLGELLATGRYPRFAAAVAQGGPPAAELGAQFERLLDRILDGLVSGPGP
ncbi:MAG TPA: TetR/AcrR family transcriptional regulator C-terminal domain-containing protein [Streptosporangiaceae bacterium]|nr:TetR/AcrR family transcriptional regulator C-terminal domain-containing protein [Streptosporangiaceae bacterium]